MSYSNFFELQFRQKSVLYIVEYSVHINVVIQAPFTPNTFKCDLYPDMEHIIIHDVNALRSPLATSSLVQNSATRGQWQKMQVDDSSLWPRKILISNDVLQRQMQQETSNQFLVNSLTRVLYQFSGCIKVQVTRATIMMFHRSVTLLTLRGEANMIKWKHVVLFHLSLQYFHTSSIYPRNAQVFSDSLSIVSNYI